MGKMFQYFLQHLVLLPRSSRRPSLKCLMKHRVMDIHFKTKISCLR